MGELPASFFICHTYSDNVVLFVWFLLVRLRLWLYILFFSFNLVALIHSLLWISWLESFFWRLSYIRVSLNRFPDFFRMGTFIDSTHMKLYSLSNESPPAAMNLLYSSNNFSNAPWKSSCVSVSMTFVTASFISFVS